jgi:hypothetical protein
LSKKDGEIRPASEQKFNQPRHYKDDIWPRLCSLVGGEHAHELLVVEDAVSVLIRLVDEVVHLFLRQLVSCNAKRLYSRYVATRKDLKRRIAKTKEKHKREFNKK